MRYVLLAGVLAVLAMRLHNAAVFPLERGYDHAGHSQAYRMVVEEGRLPTPADGWAGYHPPLYYVVCASVARLLRTTSPRVAQVVSTVVSIAAILLIAWPAYRLVPGYEMVAVAFVAALPAEVIVAPMLYNLPLGYLMASLFLGLAVEVWRRPAPGLGWALALGLVAGLGVLARPDCLMLVAFMVLLWVGRWWKESVLWRHWLSNALGGLSVAVALTAWMYLRNMAAYGRPLLANTDNELFPHFFSESWIYLPGFRSWSYYLWPDLSIWAYPAFPQGYPSYASIMFGSLWWDYYGCFYSQLPLGVSRVFLGVGAIALAVAAVGLWRAPLPIVLNLALTLTLQLAHSLRLPEDGAVKAVYLFTAYTALGLAFALGCRRLGRPALVEGLLAAWCLVVTAVFWF